MSLNRGEGPPADVLEHGQQPARSEHLCLDFGPHEQNIDSVPIQEGHIPGQGRFRNLFIDSDGTARPTQPHQYPHPAVPPGASIIPMAAQIPQLRSEVIDAVSDQSGTAVRVPPTARVTVYSQGDEGGLSGFQTLQEPSGDFQGPHSLPSVQVYLVYIRKHEAEHSLYRGHHIQSDRYQTAPSYIAATNQRLPGTNHFSQRGSSGSYSIFNASMTEKVQRERTFHGWPHRLANLTPQKLAEAGLYYTGEKDLCRCFTCGGILHRWENSDDPWVEHARLYPKCSYVHYVKGGLFIDQSRIP